MGMSASQARLLSITARMNDVEFKSQSISNTKIRLADESEQVANDYTKALNKQKLTFTNYSNGQAQKVNLNSKTLAQFAERFKLVNANGTDALYKSKVIKNANGENQVVYLDKNNSPITDSKGKYITNPSQAQDKVVSTGLKFDESTLYEMLESGQFMLQEYTKKTTADGVEKQDWYDTSVSSNTQLSIETDSTELAKAEADYNAKSKKINNKEKLLDNDLKALDTERQALKTEQDSIKSLIKDNVDKTFNLFS